MPPCRRPPRSGRPAIGARLRVTCQRARPLVIPDDDGSIVGPMIQRRDATARRDASLRGDDSSVHADDPAGVDARELLVVGGDDERAALRQESTEQLAQFFAPGGIE